MITSKKGVGRARWAWFPSIQKSEDEFCMTLKWRQARGDVVAFSKSPKSSPVKVPWGPPDSCSIVREATQEGGTDVFFR